MKDTPDRPDEYLPARRTFVPPAPPIEALDELGDPYPARAGTPRGVSPRLVWRALRRHWWQAFLLWIAGSAGLVYLAYSRIKPTYDAISQIRIENTNLQIYNTQSTTAPTDLSLFMETQVSRITGPQVIALALDKHPELHNYPLLRQAIDPTENIRRALRVAIVPKTNLIQVEMSSRVPEEASDVVNAVVDAHIAIARQQLDESTRERIDQLSETSKEQQRTIEAKRKEVSDLQRENTVDAGQEAKDRASLETYRRLSDALTNVEIKYLEVKATLDQLRNLKAPGTREKDPNRLRQMVVEDFYNDPRVATLEEQRERARQLLKDAERRSRSPSDPARMRHAERVQDLSAKINALWARLEPSLRQRLAEAPAEDPAERAIGETEIQLAALKTQKETLADRLETVRLESKAAESDAQKLAFSQRDLARAEAVLDRIESSLNQLKYEAGTPTTRILREFPARPSKVPNSRRTQVMAMAPVATGMLILSLLVLLELRGARVADPDELASRVNLQVIGVVPPLPSIRVSVAASGGPPTTNGDLRARRRLDEFVQSLDHLRVTLCARRDPWGRDRHCVLITSACGSEGKTTLAAQLAERCVNAGLMTLLIDGDLRNPTLSRMLDAASNPGLLNVLQGELAPEDVIMVIGDAGGFHLMPAGSPRVDPSRFLASDALGKLLAQARESFDMIIVDAPPVLPVPDALTIGRWTDGAVLAVRYDTSRLPLVERAYRRLAHVGVPVIGAVVNGVRSMSSAYGGYYGYGGSGYGSTAEEDSVSPAPYPTVAED